MESRPPLQRGFHYDLWANQLWLDTLPQFPDPTPATEVMRHIIQAQVVWLERCGVPMTDSEKESPLSELMQLTHDHWSQIATERNLAERVSYRTRSGEPYVNTIGEIAHHVINHGTYHRGQLRALAEVAGVAFPDTDLILYLRS